MMKPQYDLVEDVEDGSGDKDKTTHRLWTFPSMSSLRTEDYDLPKAKSHDYSSIDGEPRRRKWGPISVPAGWRFAVFGCAMSCMTSFLLNLLVTIVVVAKYGVDSSGRMQLYHGDCHTTEKLNTGVHIFINVMSTVLLSSSNYVMQCLCAVTREEVDAAHAGKRRSRWADIGVPSMFNICLMDRRRVLLWYLLLFSSLPLHLFYNSSVFSSTATYGSPIVSVNSAFITSAQDPLTQQQTFMNFTDYTFDNDTYYVTEFNTAMDEFYYVSTTNGRQPYVVNGSAEYLRRQIDVLQELDVNDCITKYAQNFQTSKGALLLVLDVPADSGTNSTNAVVFDRTASWGFDMYCSEDRYAWICAQTEQNTCAHYVQYGERSCEQQQDDLIKSNATNWRPLVSEYPVAKCYSQDLPQQCKLQASIHLIAVVLFLNAAKAVIMYLAVKWMRGTPLLTVGDAVASFLTRPDPSTKGLCLISRKEVFHDWINSGRLVDRPRVFTAQRRRWFSGSGIIRQILIVILLLIAISAIAFLYNWGLSFIGSNGSKTDLSSLWAMGIGTVNPATTIDFSNMPSSGPSGLIWSAFIANVPQLILSLIYFTYNGILTAYFLGAEWQSYMRTRKGLRVSDAPTGEQRSTYFLQLPYRAAMPLMLVSGVLHWLVSQSIFLVDIETFIWDSELDWQNGVYPYRPAEQNDFSQSKPNILTCGFSPVPMIFVLIIAAVMMLVLVALGAVPFKTTMPVASSNSLAIAAACHLGDKEFEEGNSAIKRVQWGDTGIVDEDGVGHCCFSSREVEEPKKLGLYA